MYFLQKNSFTGVFEMLGCEQKVTVWNRYRGLEGDVFIRRIVPVGCKWKSSVGRDMSASGARVDNSFTVIMPACEEYLPPDLWNAAGEEQRRECFTLQMGDLMALGEHEEEISGIVPNTKSGFRQRFAPECFEVHTVRNFTRDMRGGHFWIGGA